MGCHQPGAIGPFDLSSFESVRELKEVVADSIASERMPPWQAEPGCNEYANDIDLTAEERNTLLDWLYGDVREGDPAAATPLAEQTRSFQPDEVFQLPEPFAPTLDDDYRCQIIDPMIGAPTYVTGFNVQPDVDELVHHVIAFAIPADQRERFEAMDTSEDGPGYTCFGSPVKAGFGPEVDFEDADIFEIIHSISSGEAIEQLGGFGWLGSWAPGVGGGSFPEGTGIAMNPGDFLVLQVHYNTTSAESRADQSSIGMTFSDEVPRPAMILPYTDPAWVLGLEMLGEPMTIPAGESSVTHETSLTVGGPFFAYARDTLGIDADSPMLLHTVGTHMHTLGSKAEQRLVHENGDETCLVEIDAWDFDWQGGVALKEPVLFDDGDELFLSCTWDNSASNQPVIDGERVEPVDVVWGEGTRDEMCLGVLMVSAP